MIQVKMIYHLIFGGTTVAITPQSQSQQTPPSAPTSPVTTETPNASSSSNANLKSLKLDVEGLSPAFNKTVTQYNVVVGTTVTAIDVLATPEDSEARVSVYGNTSLNEYLNTINVVVTAQNGTTKTYTIYVTKTDTPELANANLENLAVENFTLDPEFSNDVTNYNITIGSNINELNILAVPSNSNATVSITGNENLKFGENVINITVTAEDSKTTKTYTINVYKETVEEELERVALLNESVDNDLDDKEFNNELIIIISAFVGAIAVVLSVFFIYEYVKKKNK